VNYDIPVKAIRIGFYLNDRVSIEPMVGLSNADTQNGPDATLLETSVAALYHFGSDPAKRRFFLMAGIPFVYTRLADRGNTFTESEFGLMGGVGVSVPVGHQFLLRFEGRGDAMFSSRNRFSGLVGLSFLVN